ncbi:hypothetical protein KGF38_20050 [Clostridioides sp. ZZV14-6387]|nr:hypothetical protein [Clostridioides sp. ZZV14-6387]
MSADSFLKIVFIPVSPLSPKQHCEDGGHGNHILFAGKYGHSGNSSTSGQSAVHTQ